MTQVATGAYQSRVIISGMIGPAGSGAVTFASLGDIDLTQLAPGSTLVYNSATQKWTATKLLDQQIVESGQY
jgi:hypothetical protein